MPDTYLYMLKDAEKAIEAHRLQSALLSLQGVAKLLKDFDTFDQLSDIDESYAMLLDYYANGSADPMRMQMYEKFFVRICEILEILKRRGELAKEHSYIASTDRTLQQLLGANYSLQSICPLAGKDYRTIFEVVMVSPLLSPTDETKLSTYLMDSKSDEVLSCLILSALTLGCMRFFDAAKMRILLDSALSDKTSLRARSLVGLAFIAACCHRQLKHSPDLTAHLRLMLEVPGFVDELEMVQQQIFLSLDTKRFDKEIREQLMPQVLKHFQKAKEKGFIDVFKENEKLMNPDENPEWSDGAQKELEKSIHGIAAMHARGADIYMTTFKTLKHRFPFFNNVANWFWPFTLTHPDVPTSASNSTMLRMMLNNGGICDSDKYSLCMVASMIPQEKITDFLKQLPEEFVQNKMSADEASMHYVAGDFRTELRSYVQGFYRFCNLFSHRDDFVNPFKENLFLPDYDSFAVLLRDDAWVRRQAEFVFQDKSYELAQYIYAFIHPGHYTATDFQKIGFCLENQQDYAGAIYFYERAVSTMQGNSAWTLRRLAACYRYEGQYAEALKYLRELEQSDQENASLALLIADCCIRMNDYAQAFNYLFKADYLHPGELKTIRGLAWCSLATGKYEQAEKYYAKILETSQQVQKSDYLNAGHTAWLMGNVKLAVSRYRQATAGADPDYGFLTADKDLLFRAGLTEADLALITDAVFND